MLFRVTSDLVLQRQVASTVISVIILEIALLLEWHTYYTSRMRNWFIDADFGPTGIPLQKIWKPTNWSKCSVINTKKKILWLSSVIISTIIHLVKVLHCVILTFSLLPLRIQHCHFYQLWPPSHSNFGIQLELWRDHSNVQFTVHHPFPMKPNILAAAERQY